MSLGSRRASLADRYRIERELGAGGMATVYLAEDLKHDRKVAIKLLRPELGAVIGAERFLKEIKTTANLQHPHILGLIDSGDAGGLLWYAMPFVEGESLRDRLQREKQLPIGDAVRIATEVAGALDYAHRHGVIHRDIKPENILLHDGSALVADFGIALAASTAGTRMTETGMSLGTPHYMSPEQAMGEREITARSDVYAIGCITYEMLTGDPPFTGSTAQAIVAKVVTETPHSLTAQRHTIPPHVEAAVLTALEKLPADRFATAAEFAAALKEAGTTGTPRRSTARMRAPSGTPRLVRTLGALLVVTVGAALWGWLRPTSHPDVSRQRVLLWEKPFPDFLNPSVRAENRVALAPDGSAIVFSDSVDGDTRLFIKRRGEARPVPLEGTVGAAGPFFSPDGAWIGFQGHGGTIRKIPAAGGGAIDLVASSSELYAIGTWLDDGRVVFVDKSNGLSQVEGSGGPATAFLAPDSLHRADPTSLSPLPHSRGVLFTGCPGNCASGSAVYAYDIKTDTTLLLVENATGGWYAPTGHLLYTSRNGGLFAVQFDLARMRVTSGPVSIAEGVAPGGLAMSASGDAVLSFGTEDHGNSMLVWVTRDGREVPVDSTWKAAFEYPAVSPDGNTIAVSIREDQTRLWVRRADGSRIRISNGDRGSWRPAWRPDGRSFAFATTGGSITENRSNDLFESALDGTAPPTLLLDIKNNLWEVEFSRDGQWMVVRSDEGTSFGTFLAQRTHGDTTLVQISAGKDFNSQLALSPDSRWLAYTAGLSDNAEVFVASFPDMSVRYPVSLKGGTEPRWSRDGRELFYKSRGKMMAMPVAPGAGFAPGTPRVLFPVGTYAAAINHQQYDVSPDGQRFLVIRRPEHRAVQEALLVQGFVRDLAERMK